MKDTLADISSAEADHGPAATDRTRGELVRFAICGFTSGVLYLAVLLHLKSLLPVVAASIVAYGAAMAANYFFQRIWTFRSGRPHRQALPRYAAVHLGGILINGVTLQVAAEFFGLPLIPVQTLAIGLVAAWSFALQKFWVFTASRAE
tara:strand:- start:1286 stop:1729 length:444 start_codon:yes stop_codon:yes gene_type:complete